MRYILLVQNIYILGVFAENPCIKSLERNVIYIPITRVSDVTLNNGFLQSDSTSALFQFSQKKKTACKCLMFQVWRLYKILRQGFVEQM